MTKIVDIKARKLDKANEILTPLYREIAALEEEIRLKTIEMHRKEMELLDKWERSRRRMNRNAAKLNW